MLKLEPVTIGSNRSLTKGVCMFELYGDNELIGVYSTRSQAAYDAFELLLDGCLTRLEIIEVPSSPIESLAS
jgi:hypothetical protein